MNIRGAASRLPVSAALLKNWAQLNPLVSANSGCMAGTRFWLLSPVCGLKDLAEEKPGDASDGSVEKGLSPGAGDVGACACRRGGDVRSKRTKRLARIL